MICVCFGPKKNTGPLLRASQKNESDWLIDEGTDRDLILLEINLTVDFNLLSTAENRLFQTNTKFQISANSPTSL